MKAKSPSAEATTGALAGRFLTRTVMRSIYYFSSFYWCVFHRIDTLTAPELNATFNPRSRRLDFRTYTDEARLKEFDARNVRWNVPTI